MKYGMRYRNWEKRLIIFAGSSRELCVPSRKPLENHHASCLTVSEIMMDKDEFVSEGFIAYTFITD
jgi:hypothetical protein